MKPESRPDPPAPRMSIAHIMLLTLTTAISIAVMNFVSERWATFVSPRAPDPVMDVLVIAARVWRSGMLGMSLALAAIVLTWIVRQQPKGIAPGHWLLVGLGIEAVIGILMSALAVFLLPDATALAVSPFWRLGVFALAELLLAASWFALAVQVGRTPWRLLFALEGALNLVTTSGWTLLALLQGSTFMPSGIGGIPTAVSLLQVGQLGTVLTGLIAVMLGIADRRRQRSDWLHVLGVTLMFLRIASALMYYFVPGM